MRSTVRHSSRSQPTRASAVGDDEARRYLQATRDLAYELDMAGETAETTLAKAIEDLGSQVR